MINNRQAGRRNRGRNNGRQNGGNRGGDNGNRVDNRARGNAPQLLEKYRNLARDAQLAGDRVNTEYYLQFADHYFRVLADNRSRQEEQQARFRRNDDSLDDDGYQGEGADDLAMAGHSGAGQHVAAQSDGDEDGGHGDDRRDRAPRQARPRLREAPREDRAGDENAEAERDTRRRPRKVEKIVISRPDERESAPIAPREDRAAPGEASPVAGKPAMDADEDAPVARRVTRARKPRQAKAEDAGAEEAPGLDLAVLPPALARVDRGADNDDAVTADDADGDEKPAPRRRGRRPKAEAAE